MDIARDLPIGRIRGLRACASARGHVRRPRARPSPEPAQGAPAGRPDVGRPMTSWSRSSGRWSASSARSRPACCSIPRSGPPSRVVDGSLPAGCGLLVAIEATGYDGPSTARISRVLDGWSVAKAKRMGASAAKLLVYYHPDATNAADQERLVADVAADCARRRPAPVRRAPVVLGRPEVPRWSARARRRVVVETARRLTALGGDILKAEFPYDPGVSDEGRWRDACAELDGAAALPWVLLSGGVDDATFEAQVRVACLAGASGVLVGRSVWAEAATLTGRRARDLPANDRARPTRPAGRPGRRAGHAWDARPGPLDRAPSPAPTGTADTPGDLRAPVRPARGRRAEPGRARRRSRRHSPCYGQVETIVEAIRLEIGSSSAIAACGAARLGLRTAFVGVVGDDAFGRFLLDALDGAGIDVSGCRIDPALPTGASVILTRGADRATMTAIGTIDRLRATTSPASCSPRRAISTSAAPTSSRR